MSNTIATDTLTANLNTMTEMEEIEVVDEYTKGFLGRDIGIYTQGDSWWPENIWKIIARIVAVVIVIALVIFFFPEELLLAIEIIGDMIIFGLGTDLHAYTTPIVLSATEAMQGKWGVVTGSISTLVTTMQSKVKGFIQMAQGLWSSVSSSITQVFNQLKVFGTYQCNRFLNGVYAFSMKIQGLPNAICNYIYNNIYAGEKGALTRLGNGFNQMISAFENAGYYIEDGVYMLEGINMGQFFKGLGNTLYGGAQVVGGTAAIKKGTETVINDVQEGQGSGEIVEDFITEGGIFGPNPVSPLGVVRSKVTIIIDNRTGSDRS